MSFHSDNEPKNETTPFPPSRADLIRQEMRRCSDVAVAAAIEFQESRDPALIQPIVIGVIARFIEPGMRPHLFTAGDDLKLGEDLGVDSLLMVEIVILLEDVFGITIANDDFRGVCTLADVRRLCQQHAARLAPTPSTSCVCGS